MLFNLLNKVTTPQLVLVVPIAVAFLLTFIVLKMGKRLLPKDQGRAFAVNGELSEGKPRGAGILFITVFTLCVALFCPLTLEYVIYVVLIYFAMLSGYFDDAAEKSWGNVKKGLIDLVISLGVAITYWYYNGSDISILLFRISFHIPAVLFIILAGILVWTAINVTNCSDGVDGLCATLVMCVLVPLMYLLGSKATECLMLMMMFGTLGAYLWFNCSPSKMLMGDAGSRALGVFLAVMFLRTGAPLLFIPLAVVIILDGGLGLLKLSFRRFLHIKNFMENVRTPLHDHARKKKGWADSEVVTRFALIQLAVNFVYIALIY